MLVLKKNSVSLSKKKEGILSVFSNTLKELNSLKDEQDSYQINLRLQIDKLKDESKSIENQSLETKKIINKISEFIN